MNKMPIQKGSHYENYNKLPLFFHPVPSTCMPHLYTAFSMFRSPALFGSSEIPSMPGSGRKALTVDKSHDNIVVKAKTGRDYHGISAGKMSALRK
jgi:hypothetical protein